MQKKDFYHFFWRQEAGFSFWLGLTILNNKQEQDSILCLLDSRTARLCTAPTLLLDISEQTNVSHLYQIKAYDSVAYSKRALPNPTW